MLPAEGLGRRGEGHIQMHVGWGSPPGHLQACFLTGFGPSCRGERRNPGREGDRPQVVSGCFFPSSLFSADQFVVSVPTEVSGRFSEMKILFFFRGMVGGWWRGLLGEGQATVPKYCRPREVLDFPRTLRPPALSLARGPVGILRPRQDSAVLSG